MAVLQEAPRQPSDSARQEEPSDERRERIAPTSAPLLDGHGRGLADCLNPDVWARTHQQADGALQVRLRHGHGAGEQRRQGGFGRRRWFPEFAGVRLDDPRPFPVGHDDERRPRMEDPRVGQPLFVVVVGEADARPLELEDRERLALEKDEDVSPCVRLASGLAVHGDGGVPELEAEGGLVGQLVGRKQRKSLDDRGPYLSLELRFGQGGGGGLEGHDCCHRR